MLSCVLLKILIQQKMKEGGCELSNSTKVEGEPAKRQESTKPMRGQPLPSKYLLSSCQNSLMAFWERIFHKHLGFNPYLYLRETTALHAN